MLFFSSSLILGATLFYTKFQISCASYLQCLFAGLIHYNFELNAHPNYLFISPFNASCSKLLQFGGFSTILV